jgi:hypothetical protein
VSAATHVAPALLRVLDRLHDTPALILSSLGETLVQNRMAAALLGDKSGYTGLARSEIYRWFTNPAERLRYPADDRDRQSRAQVANLRAAYALIHPELGAIEVDCQVLFTEDQSQALLVLTAAPRTEAFEKLQLLAVLGSERFAH